MTAPHSDLQASSERELLMKEADWVQAEMVDASEWLRRLTTVYAAALYGLAIWVSGRVLHSSVDVTRFDTEVWALRDRADLAIAACVLLWTHVVGTFLTLEATSQYVALVIHLNRVANRLGSPSRWRWRGDVVGLGYRSGTDALRNYGVVLPLTGVIVGAAWFSYPATHRSSIVAWCWWVSVLMYVGTVAVSGLFSRRLTKMAGVRAKSPLR